ncbi:FAD binding domain protein [Nitrosopumilaceae archaeon]|nr:NAD(P)/FAD-dependent oxidoreductase [Nitrosopumilus sp.]CAI9831148.1 FAD binding domain protein [Nitrosopumilaceae archaeon]MDA7945214.1 NAD(P)/FAD-dependent oxidoreductase [Nitrosopumilus sp.]MDA7955001.1 NAD(P)/FAD-dependent oxidoreductase [Nitrosopumilus sp.]MDA7973839.1 NAD(P)/FAD-dependent oxidoreductase [Nitrosopumilus sp.]
MYDVAVAGGSIAGLLCAREAARAGLSVAVLEEDMEVGTPEHCGGLVSLAGLSELGIIPSPDILRGHATSAVIESPSGREVELDAQRQRVAQVDRRQLDKQVARQAARAGAEIEVGSTVTRITGSSISTRTSEVPCRVAVDARGAGTLASRDRSQVIPSSQYEVAAPWIRRGQVRVMLDQERYPGFFAWVIPEGAGRGRVGAARRGGGAAAAVDRIIRERGGAVTRKIHAPIWVGGPIGSFTRDGILVAGDAAGQAKPTTAGGIFTSGMGGIMAGRAAAASLAGEAGALDGYRGAWMSRFGPEFRRQSLARAALERLGNGAIERLLRRVTPEAAASISAGSDFDFHAGAIAGLLGAGGLLEAAGGIAAGQARRLLGKL